METEEYYALRDYLLEKIRKTLETVDNDNKDDLNRISHEAIYEINKWREKNGLTRYKEVSK